MHDFSTEERLPLVSVVVPVYNVEKYLRQCLDSLLAQTLSQIEIICVNDCSPDNSAQILAEYEKLDSRIKVVSLPENRRQGGARNEGIRMAKAEYIGFVDSDDWVDATMYENLYKEAMRSESDIVAANYYEYFSESDLRVQHVSSQIFMSRKGDVLKLDGVGPVWTKIYKRKLFFDNCLFFPEKKVYEDNAVVLPLMLSASRISVVDKPLYFYRCNNQSTTRSKNNFSFFDRIATSKLLMDHLRRLGFYDRYKMSFDKAYLEMVYLWTGIGALTRFDPPQSNFVKEIKREVESVVPDYRDCQIFWNNLSIKHRIILFLIYRMGMLGIWLFLICHRVKVFLSK